jgi:hypothetical protein
VWSAVVGCNAWRLSATITTVEVNLKANFPSRLKERCLDLLLFSVVLIAFTDLVLILLRH